MKCGSRHLGKISGQDSRPQFHLSLLKSLALYGHGGTWQRKWERLKNHGGGQGSHNKPIGCGASWAHAPGQEEEEEGGGEREKGEGEGKDGGGERGVGGGGGGGEG